MRCAKLPDRLGHTGHFTFQLTIAFPGYTYDRTEGIFMVTIDFAKFTEKIREVCQNHGVFSMDYFGSVNTPAFSCESDIDFLVKFAPGTDRDIFTRYFELKERLEAIFERPVDIVIDREFKNPFFRTAVTRSRRHLYG